MAEAILNLLKQTDPDKELRASGKLPPLKKEVIGKGQGKVSKIKITKSY
jgi:hypothetical protein